MIQIPASFISKNSSRSWFIRFDDSILVRFLKHAFDFIVQQASFVIGGEVDGYLVLKWQIIISFDDSIIFLIFKKTNKSYPLSCVLFLCPDIKNAVCINVERHFNFWNTTWCLLNTAQCKYAQQIVVLCHCILTFVNLNHIQFIIYFGLMLLEIIKTFKLFVKCGNYLNQDF